MQQTIKIGLFICIWAIMVANLPATAQDTGSVNSISTDTVSTVVRPTITQPVQAPKPTLVQPLTSEKVSLQRKEIWFYYLCLLLLALGFLRTVYGKYFNDLAAVFRRNALQQKSVKDQMLQARLPSLLLNILFVIIAGSFLYRVLIYTGFLPKEWIDWKTCGLAIVFVASIYLVKYLFNLFVGWVTNQSDLAENYLFIVFTFNKILGMVLLPFLILMEFGTPWWQYFSMVAGLVMVVAFFLYRVASGWNLASTHLKVIPIHFFIYFCAFEIIPLMLFVRLAKILITNQ